MDNCGVDPARAVPQSMEERISERIRKQIVDILVQVAKEIREMIMDILQHRTSERVGEQSACPGRKSRKRALRKPWTLLKSAFPSASLSTLLASCPAHFRSVHVRKPRLNDSRPSILVFDVVVWQTVKTVLGSAQDRCSTWSSDFERGSRGGEVDSSANAFQIDRRATVMKIFAVVEEVCRLHHICSSGTVVWGE